MVEAPPGLSKNGEKQFASPQQISKNIALMKSQVLEVAQNIIWVKFQTDRSHVSDVKPVKI